MSKVQTSLLFGSLFAFVALPACGSSDTTPTPAPSNDPTFTRVTQEVLTNGRCGGPLCHTNSGIAAFHLGSKDTIYDSLLNQPATGAKCRPGTVEGGTQNYVLVVPQKPDESLLYQKIDHNPPCGDAMPVGGTLKDDQIQLVHDWIAAGAKKD